jgi:nucleoside-diphosphate-sugar epimerase
VLLQAMAGCDVVFHVAARTGAWGSWESFEGPNVVGTQQVVSACAAADVPTLVHTSTPSVVFDGADQEGADESLPLVFDSEAHYPRSKALAERYALSQGPAVGVSTVALRPHLIWGPGDTNLLPRIVERAKAGRLVRIRARGTPKLIAPTHIEDAVQAHVAAWKALVRRPELSGRAYFVTSGETVDPWKMIDGLLATQGLDALQRSVPVSVALLAASGMELAWRLTRRGDEPPLTRWVVHELTTSHWFSLDRAGNDLGYAPRRRIDEGLAELAALRRAGKC